MESVVSHYKVHILFTAIVVAGLAFAFLMSGGYYPIASVNGSFVSARKFNLEYGAADFYKNRMLTYGQKAPSIDSSELRALAMEKIIEDTLIENGARTEVGADLDTLVQNKLGELGSDTKLQTAAADLYHLDKNEFWDLVLVPQAERDILSGRLFLKGENFNNWLSAAKQSAQVSIFSNELRWTKDGVATST